MSFHMQCNALLLLFKLCGSGAIIKAPQYLEGSKRANGSSTKLIGSSRKSISVKFCVPQEI